MFKDQVPTSRRTYSIRKPN